MDLKSVISRVSGKPQETSHSGERYLAIKLSSSEILAVTWGVTSGNVSLGKIGVEKVKSDKFEDLLAACDVAVSSALGDQELPQAKTIFGVNPDWIVESKIVEEKLTLLKRLCKELDLKPLGYVLLGEAIETYLKEVEGAPLTAILIGMDKNNGWVTVFRAGKNLGTFPMGEGEDVAKKIEHCLHQFTQIEVLPARMILYDGSPDLSVLEEKIMAFPWAKQLPFLHFPKVEILSSEALTKAVAIAGGTQMGGRINEIVDDQPITNEESLEKVETETELEEISAEDAGFIQDGNLGKLKDMSVAEEVVLPKPSLPKINFDFKKILAKIPKFSRPNFKLPKTGLVIIPVIAALLIGLVVFFYFVPKTSVFIHVTPKPFRQELMATISGQFVDVSEIGTKKGVATGQKLVGDKAHGSVTIYGAGSARTFSAGTTITSPDGLKFVLDQSATVASASDFLSPSTTTVTATAFDIGDKYNLPQSKFTFSATSSYLAKNDSAFSGGTSHQATVVTKSDQDRLFATLSAELSSKAQNDLNGKLESNQTLLPNAITSVVSAKKFSKDVDMEADTVSLDLTLDFKGITVSKDDLISRFLDKYSSDIADGYKLDSASAQPEIKSAKLDKSGNAVLDVTLDAKSLPTINSVDLIKSLAGKSYADATKLILSQNGTASVVFDTKFKFLPLPWKPGNITLEVVSD